MNLVAADVSPLHLIQSNVRADSRRLLRSMVQCPKFVQEFSLRGVEANLVDGRGVIVRHGRDRDADEPHARRGELQPMAGSAECVFALVTKRFPMVPLAELSTMYLYPGLSSSQRISPPCRSVGFGTRSGTRNCWTRVGQRASPGLVPVNQLRRREVLPALLKGGRRRLATGHRNGRADSSRNASTDMAVRGSNRSDPA